MLDELFGGIFSTNAASITIGNFILCLAVSLIIGLVLSFVFSIGSKSSKSFTVTLAVLPAIVCVVIMAVNGNVGTGVAVAGSFSLIRFRSAPGSAREIGAIFIAMTAGIITGIGYIGYAVLFTLIIGAAYFILNAVIGGKKDNLEKTLRVTIPENLDYNGLFDDLFEKHTKSHEVVSVKTAGMGSLFKITYKITLKTSADEKELIDGIRCRNGNLEISSSIQETSAVTEL